MIKIQNVSKVFTTGLEKKIALDDVSFEIPEGKCIIIGGENGSGKSVLMSIIAGLDNADSGTIDLAGKRVGLVFQESDLQIVGETVEKDLMFGPENLLWPNDKIEAKVNEMLELFSLTKLRTLFISC